FRSAPVLKHAVNLRCSYASERKVGKIMLCKESDLAGLSAAVGFAAGDFAMKEHLVDRVRMSRYVAMPAIIPHRSEFYGAHQQTRVFCGFPLDAFGRRLIYVRPPSRQGPFSIADFDAKHDTPLTEHDGPHIYFRGRITRFPAKEVENLPDLDSCPACHYRAGD